MKDRSLSAVLIVIMGLLVVLLGPTVPAVATETSDEAVTWSLRPAGENGSDGRSWVELELDPGASVTEYAQVQNFSDREVEFSLQSADGYFTDTGRFNMLDAGTPSTDAGLWIDITDSVVVPAGGEVTVPFTVTVPADASPGDHPAGVSASIFSSGTTDGGAAVGIESRVGFRVMTRVSGDFVPDLTAKVAARYSMSWNPFRPGTVNVDYALQNAGNIRLGISPEIIVEMVFGAGLTSVSAPKIAEIAPGEVSRASVEVNNIWPLAVLHVSIRAEGRPVLDAESTDPVQVQETVSVVAVPWPQLITLIIAAGIIVMFIVTRRRQRKAIAAQLEQARAEGRREASAPSADV
ncbi:hypothetical protein E8P82_06785 [Arthrobacter echini]|uniref:DUF916 domain-containing protein n=1 Tax=Arthrobacter echini TaxID=1529066 RepID=A0A4S5E6B7_9MICC|nr:hypothetical protein [Arthrobacter echini]THJ67136.1 hypothetical protein E8P82_06785 [Arthrobacter echini]